MTDRVANPGLLRGEAGGQTEIGEKVVQIQRYPADTEDDSDGT